MVRFYVGPELVPCVGVGETECMMVSETAHGEYLLFYDVIEGFEFKPGIKYTLDVAVTEIPNPPADASALAYRLIRVVAEE